MRFYELAKKFGMETSKLHAEAQAAGFEVSSTLSSVSDELVKWVENKASATESEEAPAPKAAPKKKKAAKKVSSAAPKSDAEDTAPAAAEETPPAAESTSEEAETTSRKPGKKKRRKSLRAITETETPAEEEAAPPEVAAPVEETTSAAPVEEAAVEPAEEAETADADVTEAEDVEASEEETTEETASQKKENAEEETHHRHKKERSKRLDEEEEEERKRLERLKKKEKSDKRKMRIHELEEDLEPEPFIKTKDDEAIDEDAAELLLKEEKEEELKVAHKHKRADFKTLNRQKDLPSIFADISPEYTRSVAGAGKARRPSRGATRGRFRGRQRRRVTSQAPRERDPNAVAELQPGMTVRELSIALGVKLNSIVGYLMKSGVMMQVNDVLPEDQMTLIADEFDIKYEWKKQADLEEQLSSELTAQEEEASDEFVETRAPVVTFLGHVDHGKTSLLDKIRETRIAAGEAGGITQHIGAYSVEIGDNQITFLDTPGHEAFTAMRARGAKATDIAVLVVAADDGVMPQTAEAVSHARNAGVPIVVAVNKCDLASANPEKVRSELSNKLQLLPEEWGGQTGMIDVSAMTGEGIDELLERILLEAEVLELTCNPARKATGIIVEAEMTENRGVVATMLVQDGTLKRGDVVLSNAGYGKVKLMYDHLGNTINEAGPSEAVSFTGLNAVPEAGDPIYVLDDILKARAIAEEREQQARSAALAKRSHVTLENLMTHLSENEVRQLNVIVKADVSGSIEVMEKTLTDLSTDEVKINILHSAVGGINQADVLLADASDAIVVGFHVVADGAAKLAATNHGVQIKIYHIIYRLIEDMRAALEGMLPPEEKEIVQGHIEIRQVFKASRIGNIAGCFVTDGIVQRNSQIRLIRNNVVIYDGKLDTLKRFKDDAREVRSGFECGLKVANYDDIKEGDIIQAYTVEEVARKLEG